MAAAQIVTGKGQTPPGELKPGGEIAARGAGSAPATTDTATAQALLPLPPFEEGSEARQFSAPVLRLPVELEVSVPVREFRVRHLLSLAPRQIVESQWGHGNDLPLAAGHVQLAWTEFEVVETRLAVRVTRLA